MKWRYAEHPEEVMAGLKGEGYTLCALEITDQSLPYHAYDYPDKICLVVGHEDHGVTRQALALCDAAVFVPMYGKGRSLNVHVCLGVVCYHILHSGISGGGKDER